MLIESNQFKRLCDIGNEVALNNSTMSQRHSAIVLRGSSIVSIGVNNIDRCTFGGVHAPGCHAEMDALMRIPKKKHYRGRMQMIIMHPSKDKNFNNKPSKPCTFCITFLHQWGIDKVYYMCPESNKFVCRRTRDLLNDKVYYTSFVRNMGGKNLFK